MQKMNFYKNCKSVTVSCINEPLKETDEVYVISDGKLYKWDNTVTDMTDKYLEHFKEVSINDCPQIFKACSDSSVSFLDVVAKIAAEEKIKYESNSNNPVKTERCLLDNCLKIKYGSKFPMSYKRLSLEDDLSGICEWLIKVNKNATDDSMIPGVVTSMIPKGYNKDELQDDKLKQVLFGSLVVSLEDKHVNRVFSIIKAVKDYCDNLKAAKESKKQSNAAKEEKTPNAKEEKKQDNDEVKKSNEAA